MTDPLRGFCGDLLRPGDPGYDDARRVHNGMIDRRPALIARCRHPDDASLAVAHARERGLELSVRGGGHNVAGRAVTEGGVMVDLSLLTAVEVDPDARTARVQGGATWGQVDRATQAHGLAVTGGMISTTGVGGLTLGGGLGWLMGKHGLTVDNLRSAEVATADDRVLRASERAHPALFWGLRGGGGNFGLVRSFELRLHPVGPVVTGVRAAAPFSSAADLLRFYRDFAAELPDEMTLNAGLRHAADGSGRKLAGLLGCHVGPAEQAERDLRPLLELPASVEREVGPLPYTTLNSLLDPVYPRGAWNYWKSGFLHGLSDEAIARLLEWFGRTPSSMTTVVIENLRGAVTRVPAEATAFPHRDPGFNLLLTSVWSDPAATGRNVEWTRRTHATLAPHLAERCYATYLAEDEVGEAATRAAFGPNAERLAEVKRVYDPANLFRLNQNVRPARGAR